MNQNVADRNGPALRAPRLVWAFLVCFSTPLWGQTSGSGQPQTPPGQTAPVPDPAGGSKSDATANGISKDRLFFVLPDFLTLENAGKVPPLSSRQKFRAVAQGTFDPVEFVWWGIVSGIGQWQDSDPALGQGAKGYGERYATNMADSMIENFMTGAVFASLLHQDPRYFQKGKGGFWIRTAYAVRCIFITRGDNGKTQFNFSEILGSATAAGISTYTYYPRDERNIPNALGVWGSQVGYDTLTAVVREFWPDIRRKIKKH